MTQSGAGDDGISSLGMVDSSRFGHRVPADAG